jgi:hypothetical protein
MFSNYNCILYSLVLAHVNPTGFFSNVCLGPWSSLQHRGQVRQQQGRSVNLVTRHRGILVIPMSLLFFVICWILGVSIGWTEEKKLLVLQQSVLK